MQMVSIAVSIHIKNLIYIKRAKSSRNWYKIEMEVVGIGEAMFAILDILLAYIYFYLSFSFSSFSTST